MVGFAPALMEITRGKNRNFKTENKVENGTREHERGERENTQREPNLVLIQSVHQKSIHFKTVLVCKLS